MLSVNPGKVAWEALCSLALLIRLSWLSEDWVPLPLKTRVCARLGVTTIIPGVFPAVMGLAVDRMSFCASRMATLATAVPELTLLEINARYFRPLVWVPAEGVDPQLIHVNVAGKRNNSRIMTFFKPLDSNFKLDNHLDASRGL